MKKAIIVGGVTSLVIGLGVFAMRRTSKTGIDLIKQWELFVPTPYRDPIGLWTIGWGHLIKEGEQFTRISKAEGEALLAQDLAEAERAVTELVKVPLNKNQFDALVSFTFNLGRGSLQRSTLLKHLNNGLYDAAAGQFQRWIYAGGQVWEGLKRRRAHERELFERAVA